MFEKKKCAPAKQRLRAGLSSRGVLLCVALFSLFLTFAWSGAARAQTASASNLGVANDFNLFVFQNLASSGEI